MPNPAAGNGLLEAVNRFVTNASISQNKVLQVLKASQISDTGITNRHAIQLNDVRFVDILKAGEIRIAQVLTSQIDNDRILELARRYLPRKDSEPVQNHGPSEFLPSHKFWRLLPADPTRLTKKSPIGESDQADQDQ